MTVSSTTTRNSSGGNGVLDTFSYGFKIFDDDDITVIIRTDSTGAETVKTKNTHYTVTGVGSASGGNIVFTSGNIPASGETVVRLRTTARTQLTDYVANDPFPAESHENALDKLTFITQELEEQLGRSLKVSQTNVIATSEFTADATARANKLLGFDGSGDLSVTEGKVDTVTATASNLSAGATPTASATYTGSSGTLAIAFGIPAGNTGATGPAGAAGADGADGGLADVVGDTTPQLGGDLDVNGQDIVTTSNADIELNPNGTGKTVLKGNTNPGTLVFNCESNTHGQTVKSQPHSATVTNTLTLPPGGDGELVSTVATQTLTNKSIAASQLTSLAAANIVATNAQSTFTKAQVPSTYTAALSATSGVLDFDTYQNFIVTLAAGANTLAAPTTEASQIGQTGVIILIQPSSGSAATLSHHTDYETAGAATLTLSSANSAYDVLPYIVKADNSILLGAAQLAFA